MSGRQATGGHRVLIVSPHFPPVNAPDMQRIRMSLPYFREFGWEPFVLAVRPDGTEALDPLLSETVPEDVTVDRVRPLPASICSWFGVGNIALRALPQLYARGCRLISSHAIDLVYFSTTMFLSMPLGRVWKRQFGTSYVLDMQDPWVSDYYDTHPDARRPPKMFAAQRMHAIFEPWTMSEADGIIAVSPDYIDTLRQRYPRLKDRPCVTLPFGAARGDFDLIARHPRGNEQFSRHDGRLHGVYAGRAGDDLAPALDIVFRALKAGLQSAPELFGRVAIDFVGTDYATDGRARKTVEPIAQRAGVAAYVREQTARLPYFDTLQLLEDADFLLIAGSDDPAYTASKVYPYILARKPLLAVVHEHSTIVSVLRETRAGVVVTFSSAPDENERAAAAGRLLACWRQILAAPRSPDTDWAAFDQYTAREMTRRQCDLFDDVLACQPKAA